MYDFRISDARRAYAQKNGIRFTQEDAAKHFDVSIGTYRNWEQGRVGLNAGQLSEIADLYQVTVDYLLGNANGDHRHEASDGPPNNAALSNSERKLVDLFRKLPPTGQHAVLSGLEDFANQVGD